MFANKNETPSSPGKSPDGRTNRISEGTVIVGNINAEGDLRIEGKVIGTLVCNSKLVVSNTGSIEGNVDARMATVEGEIKGNVVTRELLTISSTGKIFGDIFTQKLVVEMGAIFTGNSKMADAAKEVLQKSQPAAKELLSRTETGSEAKPASKS